MSERAFEMRPDSAFTEKSDLNLLALADVHSGAVVRQQSGEELEKSALEHALSHSPTPRRLGAEGCMAAIDAYVLHPYFERHGIAAPQFNSTYGFVKWFKENGLGETRSKSIHDLTTSDLKPGDIVIAKKVDGSQHAMVVTRVPEEWGYPPDALMFTGNTGRRMPDGPPYPHYRAAQEVIGSGTDEYNHHHGQINSRRKTNPYLGGTATIIRFK